MKKGIGLGINLCTLGFVGSIIHVIIEDRNLSQAERIKKHQVMFGVKELDPESQQKVERAENYLRNHYGNKLLTLFKDEHFYERKIGELIQKKAKMAEEDNVSPDLKEQLLSDISQLNQLYRRTSPKTFDSVQQLAQDQHQQRP